MGLQLRQDEGLSELMPKRGETREEAPGTMALNVEGPTTRLDTWTGTEAIRPSKEGS